MKVFGWALVIPGALLVAWGLGVLGGKAPGAGVGWWAIALVGLIVFTAGWAGIRLSRRH